MSRPAICSTIALMAGGLLPSCATRPPVAATLDALTLRAPEQPAMSPRGVELAVQVIAYDNAPEIKRLWIPSAWREPNPNASAGTSGRRNTSPSDTGRLASGQVLSLPLPSLAVRARNLTGQPIRISVDQFALRDVRGRRYPPYRTVAEIQSEMILRLEQSHPNMVPQTHEQVRGHISRLPLFVGEVELAAGAELAALMPFRLGIHDLREQHQFLTASGELVLEVSSATAGSGAGARTLTIPLKTTRAPVKVWCASGITQPSFEDCKLEP